MKTIWKYTLEPDSTIDMPIGAEVLAVDEQRGEPQVWALVDPSANTEKRRFVVYGTGQTMDNNPGRYIGTLQLLGGTYVFHVFEIV